MLFLSTLKKQQQQKSMCMFLLLSISMLGGINLYKNHSQVHTRQNGEWFLRKTRVLNIPLAINRLMSTLHHTDIDSKDIKVQLSQVQRCGKKGEVKKYKKT